MSLIRGLLRAGQELLTGESNTCSEGIATAGQLTDHSTTGLRATTLRGRFVSPGAAQEFFELGDGEAPALDDGELGWHGYLCPVGQHVQQDWASRAERLLCPVGAVVIPNRTEYVDDLVDRHPEGQRPPCWCGVYSHRRRCSSGSSHNSIGPLRTEPVPGCIPARDPR